MVQQSDTLSAKEMQHKPIRIKIESLESLFDPLDPAPRHTRLIRDELIAYIADRTVAHGMYQPIELVLGPRARRHRSAIRAAFKRSFGELLARTKNRRRYYLYVGLRLFAISTLFMLTLTLIRATLLETWQEPLPGTLDQGLIILAWVIFWRPADYLLFDWIPLYQEIRLYRRLSSSPLRIHEHV